MFEESVKKIIGVFPVCNTGGICVHQIEGDRVLASVNGKDPEWCEIAEKPRCEIGGDADETEMESGFMVGSFFVPFSEVMRV